MNKFQNDDQNKLHKNYLTIWKKYSKHPKLKSILERGFTFQFDNDESKSDILFFGINSAYKNGDKTVHDSYTREISNDLPYSKSFKKFMNEINIGQKENYIWKHIDLFIYF